MCGIVGYIGTLPAGETILEGLRMVSYRGYDSAGIASLDDQGSIHVRRAEGKLDRLTALLAEQPIPGTIGIGHTRWATHGTPNERNAHPHVAGNVAVVHNGIIENFAELRRDLERKGRRFLSETDSEVIPHLIDQFIGEGASPFKAVQRTILLLDGSFALAILFKGHNELLMAASRKSPLLIGFGSHGGVIGSDLLAIAGIATRFIRLEDGEIATIKAKSVSVSDGEGVHVLKNEFPLPITDIKADKAGYAHFMRKEIHEQPVTVRKTLEGSVMPLHLPLRGRDISRFSIVACGTAYYAGLIAKHWIEELTAIPTECEAASEFLYRRLLTAPGQVGILISQSGETADTIAALKKLKEKGVPTVAIVNVPGSTMAGLVDHVICTAAWPEIAVASTKAFTAQLATLAWIAIETARERTDISLPYAFGSIKALNGIPDQIRAVLALENDIAEIAKSIAAANDVFYIGRGTNYHVALEGALKLKEIAYIHAEAAPAGELKHGPLALIDKNMPTIVIAPRDQWFDKTLSNIEEIAARAGKIILLSDKAGCSAMAHRTWRSIVMPDTDPLFAPIPYAVAVQLIAYHAALAKGTSIDQPRNLAKSVTVE